MGYWPSFTIYLIITADPLIMALTAMLSKTIKSLHPEILKILLQIFFTLENPLYQH